MSTQRNAFFKSFKVVSICVAAAGLLPAGAEAGYVEAVAADNPFLWLRMQEPNADHTTVAANSGSSGVNGLYLRTGGTGGSFTDIPSMAATLDFAKLFNRLSPEEGAFIALGAQGAPYAALASFTIEFLFKPTSYDAGLEAVFATSDWGEGAVHLNLSDGNLELYSFGGGPRLWPSREMATVAPVGQWSHVAVTYAVSGEGTVCALYVNGNMVGAPSVLPGVFTANFNLEAAIGSWQGNKRQMNDGFDEFAVYANALSQAQVQAHFNALPPRTPDAPQPADNAADVAVGTSLSWACAGTNGYEVSLWSGGVTQRASVGTARWDPPGALKSAAGYSWQVVATNPYGSSTGGVWTFTTARAPGYVRAVAADDPFLWLRMQELNASHMAVAANSGASGVNCVYQQTGGTGGSFGDIPSMAAALDSAKLLNRLSPESGAWLYVAAQGAPYAALASFTIEFLFKPTSYDVGLEAVFATFDYWAGGVHLNLNDGNLELAMAAGGSRLVPAREMAAVAPVGQWSHVAVTYADSGGSSTCTLYVNGNMVGAPSVVPGTYTANFNMEAAIGSWLGYSRQMDDGLDEFAVYDRALTQAQVRAHYNALFPQGSQVLVY